MPLELNRNSQHTIEEVVEALAEMAFDHLMGVFEDDGYEDTLEWGIGLLEPDLDLETSEGEILWGIVEERINQRVVRKLLTRLLSDNDLWRTEAEMILRAENASGARSGVGDDRAPGMRKIRG